MANVYNPHNSISGGETYNSRSREIHERINTANRQSANGVRNLKVREQKLKELRKKKRRAKLKRISAFGMAVVTAVTIGAGAVKYSKQVSRPDGLDYSGKMYSVSKTIGKRDSIDFALLYLNNWEKGVPKKTEKNMDYCLENEIPFGVVMDSNADNLMEAKADAYKAMASVSKDAISCPVYYNVDSICDLSDDLFCDITETFIDELNDNGYTGALAISEDNLSKLNKELDESEKMIICSDKKIEYDGQYNMAYFEKSGEVYSNLAFPKAKKMVESKPYSKGIDVSQYQGTINWEKVQKDGVEYAIIRFSGFKGYHSTGNLRIDTKFYENIAECQRLGIPFGVYCFTTAETEAEAKKEAKEVLKVAKALNLDNLKIYYDIEMQKHFDNPSLSVDLFKSFYNEITSNGFDCGLYASYSLCETMCRADPSIREYDKWVARYLYDKKDSQNNPTLDDITENYTVSMHEKIGRYEMVQVTSKGIVDGITENTVDVNITIPETTYKSY